MRCQGPARQPPASQIQTGDREEQAGQFETEHRLIQMDKFKLEVLVGQSQAKVELS